MRKNLSRVTTYGVCESLSEQQVQLTIGQLKEQVTQQFLIIRHFMSQHQTPNETLLKFVHPHRNFVSAQTKTIFIVKSTTFVISVLLQSWNLVEDGNDS